MDRPLNLPGLYELIELDTVDDLKSEAKQRAEAGAAEGTIIWAKQQSNAYGRGDHRWWCGPGNLYCCIILRPDFPFETTGQLSIVASLSLGMTLGALLSPMVSLRYRWPNDVLIAQDKVAGIWIDTENKSQAHSVWTIITLAVNVATHPDDSCVAATSIKIAEGNSQITRQTLLEDYARHFLKFINQWAENGPRPLVALWKQRLEDLNSIVTIRLNDTTIEGRLVDVDENGGVILQTAADGRITISTNEFFDLN